MLRVRATLATFLIPLAVGTFVEGTLEAQETVTGGLSSRYRRTS